MIKASSEEFESRSEHYLKMSDSEAVVITEDGKSSFVLISFDKYKQIVGGSTNPKSSSKSPDKK